jgi:hypothetical protein
MYINKLLSYYFTIIYEGVFMKKSQNKNKFQQNEKTDNSAEVEIQEDELLTSDETADEIIEIEPEEHLPGVDEIEEIPSEDKIEIIPDSELQPVAENPEVTAKQKIKALKRAMEFKQSAIEREEIKVKDWRVQAKDRDEKATSEFEKRKTMLEESLKKNEERYQKRIAKTEKWWWQYCINHEATKIKKLQDDLSLLQTELTKLEEKPTAAQ